MFGYALFCDHLNLKRVDATPEEHLANLDKMAMAMVEFRVQCLKQIQSRCATCQGTGKVAQ